jgi:hypothetical protein
LRIRWTDKLREQLQLMKLHGQASLRPYLGIVLI